MTLGIGLALVALAFPRLMSALQAVPAGPVIEKINRGDRTLTPGELLVAREALNLSLIWERDGAAEIKLARITLALAAREFQLGGNPDPMARETIAAAQDGLALAPGQARGWLLLAEATLAQTGDAGTVVGYLLESIRASPHDVWLAPHRAELGLRAWPWLDPAARSLIMAQIRIVGERTPDRLVDMARRAGDPSPVREALANDKERLLRFDARYLQGR